MKLLILIYYEFNQISRLVIKIIDGEIRPHLLNEKKLIKSEIIRILNLKYN